MIPRILKFRAWNGHQIVLAVDLSKGGMLLWLDVYDYPLMQFTGLLDKNRKEIYEGDVVRILYTDWPSQTPDESGNYSMTIEEYKISRSVIGYVSWDDYGTGWVIRTKSKYSVNDEGTVMTSIIHGTHGEREVIGNIYENPELLK
jgi:uncharacterized phage protein (TIGR01671 family)